MKKTIIVVDDEASIRNMVATRLSRLDDDFLVETACDGFEAVKILERGGVSLVISDIKMPKMDGIELLTYIMQRHPSIPVILVTGYSTSTAKKRADELGAVEFMHKPFDMNYLMQRVQSVLSSQEDGGVLMGVSLTVFVHLIEMENKTCTIRVVNKKAGMHGSLFFSTGDLIDARCGSLAALDAAYEIFSWEKADIKIQNACTAKERKITVPLQAIMLESLRIKDEVDAGDQQESTSTPEPPGEAFDPLDFEAPIIDSVEMLSTGDLMVDHIREALSGKLSEAVERVTTDTYWDPFIETARNLGLSLRAGELRLLAFTTTDGKDYVVAPSEETVAVGVWKKSMRDKVRDTILEIVQSR